MKQPSQPARTECSRQPPSFAELEAELRELVDGGLLEPIVDGDGVTRYQRAGGER